MEKCKYCQEELAEDTTVCPGCGRDNAEPETAQETVKPVEEPASDGAAAEEAVPAEEAAAEEEISSEEAAVSEENAAEEEKPAAKATPGKIALAVAAVVLLAAALIALIVVGLKSDKAEDSTIAAEASTVEDTIPATIPEDGDPENVTCKGTYTVTDDVAIADADTVVATMGDDVLTNSQLRIYYRSALSTFMNSDYGYYMMIYGALDYTKPLDTQLSTEGEGLTWQQYFVQRALDSWRLSQAMANEAEKTGLEMPQEDQEYLDSLRDSLEQTAAQYSVTVDDMLYSDFGAGVSYEDFELYQLLYLQGNPYYEAETAKLVPTQEDLEAFFAENEETYASGGITRDSRYVDVRHILIQIEGGTTDESGTTVYSDEDWAACEAEAQAVLDEWLAGDKTEDSFAELAKDKSEDPGSRVNGGLYEDVYVGQMVEPFEAWCFDESRVYGDYGLVKTSYGYHVMYFVDTEPMWISYAEGDWINEKTNQMLTDVMEAYPMDVTYENITLSELNMT